MAFSTVIPFRSAEIPWRLPLHPPVKANVLNDVSFGFNLDKLGTNALRSECKLVHG